MDNSTPSLLGAVAILACVIWLLFEAIRRGLNGRKDEWWAQLILKWGPIVLGAALCTSNEILVWLIEQLGYEPKKPPTGMVSIMIGSISGAASVVYYHQLTDKLNGLVDKMTASKKTASTPPEVPAAPVPDPAPLPSVIVEPDPPTKS